MTKTERCAIFAAIICGFSLTAGITDMMVNEASAISYNSGTNRLYQQAQNQVFNQPLPQQAQQIQQEENLATPQNTAIFACVQHGKKWQVVDGNTAGPISAPLFATSKACMKQVNDWNTP